MIPPAVAQDFAVSTPEVAAAKARCCAKVAASSSTKGDARKKVAATTRSRIATSLEPALAEFGWREKPTYTRAGRKRARLYLSPSPGPISLLPPMEGQNEANGQGPSTTPSTDNPKKSQVYQPSENANHVHVET
jgi:hypothetical protein